MLAYQFGIDKFKTNNAVVLAISTDNVPSQKEFATKLSVAFPMISDFRDRSTAKAYGVLRPDGMANRTTFLIDKDGKIDYVEQGNTAIDPLGADTACSRLAHRSASQGK
jgi:peroxiredoxin